MNIEIPKWFKVTAIIALVWNILGVMAFASHMMMTPEMLAELPANEQALYENTPMWATVAFAFAVIGGALGSLLMVLKKSLASQILIASLIGVLIQMYHSFFMINSIEVYGPGGMVMPIMVIIIAFALVWLSMQAEKNKWYD